MEGRSAKKARWRKVAGVQEKEVHISSRSQALAALSLRQNFLNLSNQKRKEKTKKKR